MSVDLINEDFKIKVMDLGSLSAKDVMDGFLFLVLQGKTELSIEPAMNRKKLIFKVYDSNGGYPEIFEFTPTQLKGVLRSNTAKKAIKSDEGQIIENAERAKRVRKVDDDGSTNSKNAVRKTRRRHTGNEELQKRSAESSKPNRKVTRKRA